MFSKLKSLSSKQDIDHYIKNPIAAIGIAGASGYVPAIKGGELFSLLEANSTGIPCGHLACINDMRRISWNLTSRKNVEVLFHLVPHDATASHADQSLWLGNERAVADREKAIITIHAAENNVLTNFREAMRSNEIISSYIGNIILEDMHLYELLDFINNTVLSFTVYDINIYKTFMKEVFVLDSNSIIKPSLQFEKWLGKRSSFMRFASRHNITFRNDELMEFLRSNFNSSSVTIYYQQQLIRNGLSTDIEVIDAIKSGIINLDIDDSWKSGNNRFVFNAITTDTNSDDDSLSSVVVNATANAILPSSIKKKKNKQRITKISALGKDHPETFCNYIGHGNNAKQQTHSNQACWLKMLVKMRQDKFNVSGTVTDADEMKMKAQAISLASSFPAPK